MSKKKGNVYVDDKNVAYDTLQHTEHNNCYIIHYSYLMQYCTYLHASEFIITEEALWIIEYLDNQDSDNQGFT